MLAAARGVQSKWANLLDQSRPSSLTNWPSNWLRGITSAPARTRSNADWICREQKQYADGCLRGSLSADEALALRKLPQGGHQKCLSLQAHNGLYADKYVHAKQVRVHQQVRIRRQVRTVAGAYSGRYVQCRPTSTVCVDGHMCANRYFECGQVLYASKYYTATSAARWQALYAGNFLYAGKFCTSTSTAGWQLLPCCQVHVRRQVVYNNTHLRASKYCTQTSTVRRQVLYADKYCTLTGTVHRQVLYLRTSRLRSYRPLLFLWVGLTDWMH